MTVVTASTELTCPPILLYTKNNSGELRGAVSTNRNGRIDASRKQRRAIEFDSLKYKPNMRGYKMAQSSENTKVYDGPVLTQTHEVESKTNEKLFKDSASATNSLAGSARSILSEIDPSSPESTKKAESALDSKVSGLLPQDDQNLLKAMNHAVVEGDTKALGAAIASMKDDPAKLKNFIDELQKNLNQSDAGVNISVTKDGNVVVYKQDDSAGVQYDSKTGKPTVVPIEHQDGNVILGQGEVLNKTPDDVAKDIGLSAREGILGLSLKFPPLFPDSPSRQLPIPDVPPMPGPDFPNRPRGEEPTFPDFPPPGHGIDPDWNDPTKPFPPKGKPEPDWNDPTKPFPPKGKPEPDYNGRDE